MAVNFRIGKPRSMLHLSLTMLCGAVWLVACSDIKLPLPGLTTSKIDRDQAGIASVQEGFSELPRLPEPEMIRFADPTAGFRARIPQRWQRSLINTPDDAGITVSFESPRSGENDKFADYLMIDIQPGSVVEVFERPADERTAMTVAGQTVYRERISLDNHPVADTHLDLLAWQLTFRKPGYSVAIYVVGERREEARLERVMIEFAYSFSMPVPPFLLT